MAALNFNSKRVPFSPFDEASDGKLGSVYTRVTETLLDRGDWDRKAAMRNKATGELKLPSSYGLLLGTAQGKGVPWGRLGYGVWPPPLVNYCRGFDLLTRKGKLVNTLEQAKVDCEGGWPKDAGGADARAAPASSWAATHAGGAGASTSEARRPGLPPSKGEANPREQAARRHARRAGGAPRRRRRPSRRRRARPTAAASRRGGVQPLILKPSEGAKGEGIFIEETLEAIEAHLDKQEERAAEGEAVSSWVVQAYIPNPLLLAAGNRKFDMRCWVLVDADYGVHLYRHGVLRCASASYDASDVNDRFAHLTNHCIATEHAEYGKDEPTNEKFYPSFDAELAARYPSLAAAAAAAEGGGGVTLFGRDGGATSGPGFEAADAATAGAPGSVLESVVLPQIRRHVVQTMLAARERLEADGEYYRPFQLYGYDFLVDDELRVWLCEINASPAVADELLPGLVGALVRTAVDKVCPPNKELMREPEAYERAAAEAGPQCFECIFEGAAASGRAPRTSSRAREDPRRADRTTRNAWSESRRYAALALGGTQLVGCMGVSCDICRRGSVRQTRGVV